MLGMPGDAFRVLCIPHAGAGAGATKAFRDAAPDTWDVRTVVFGGRESRFIDDVPEGFRGMVNEVLEAIDAYDGVGPLVLVGQCSGAMLAAAAAVEHPEVSGLVVLSRGAPGSPATVPTLPDDDAEAGRAIVDWGGVPPEVAAEPDLLELLLPAFRADLDAAAEDPGIPEDALKVPVLVCRAAGDPAVPAEAAAAWRRHAADLEVSVVGDDHFVFGASPDALISRIDGWRAGR